MKVNFAQALKTLDGALITEGDKVITLKRVCQTALLGQYQQEQADGQEKARRWLLATTLKDDELDITPEDAALLKKVIGYAYTPLVVGQAYEMLNG